jgi:hypothetical protein
MRYTERLISGEIYNYTETTNENHQPKVAPEYIKEIQYFVVSTESKSELDSPGRYDCTCARICLNCRPNTKQIFKQNHVNDVMF